LLLLQFATNNSFAEQVIKLPALFTHFYHHRSEHKDITTFADFLYIHYYTDHEAANPSQKDDGDDGHCKLPFKHCGNCVNAHTPVVGFLPTVFITSFSIPQQNNYCFRCEDDRIQSLEISAIWQPPKLG
jgi:hypothetical protein